MDLDEVTDPIEPVSIEHPCDDIVINGKLEQRYNHLVYVFERAGLRWTARAYLDDIETVSLISAELIGEDSIEPGAAQAMRKDIISYFDRRYQHIDELMLTGYQEVER